MEEYQCHDASGVTDYAPGVTRAADLVVEWAREDMSNHGDWDSDEPYCVTVPIGRASAAYYRPAAGATVTTVCFAQTAAAVPVATMRRALELAEAHDPELAAELRASLVEPE